MVKVNSENTTKNLKKWNKKKDKFKDNFVTSSSSNSVKNSYYKFKDKNEFHNNKFVVKKDVKRGKNWKKNKKKTKENKLLKKHESVFSLLLTGRPKMRGWFGLRYGKMYRIWKYYNILYCFYQGQKQGVKILFSSDKEKKKIKYYKKKSLYYR